MEKQCTKCKQVKAFDKFNKRKSASDGLQYHCRECERNNHSIHYEKSKARYIERARSNTKKYIGEYIEWKKTLVCEVCGESDSACIDLHHLDPTKKDFNVGDVGHRSGMRSVLKEIDKCVCVCANCHRKTHKYGNDWFFKNKKFTSTGGRVV